MKLRFFPVTTSGRIAVYSLAMFFAAMLSFYLLLKSGQQGGEEFLSNSTLAIPIMIAGIVSVISLFTGVFSVLIKKERAILVILAICNGAFVTWFALAEMLNPH